MNFSLALAWRLLLAFALVANPLAAAAMPCHESPAAATVEAAATPPCHASADAGRATPATPAPHEGHDCAKAGCDFASCCASCAFATVGAPPALQLLAQGVGRAEGSRALAGPPLPPLIRPPIA